MTSKNVKCLPDFKMYLNVLQTWTIDDNRKQHLKEMFLFKDFQHCGRVTKIKTKKQKETQNIWGKNALILVSKGITHSGRKRGITFTKFTLNFLPISQSISHLHLKL